MLASRLAFASFPAHPLAAVPCVVSACVHTALGGLAAAYWAERPAGDTADDDLAGGGGGSCNGYEVSGGGYPAGVLSSRLLTLLTEAGDAVGAVAARAGAAVNGLRTSLQASAADILERLRQQTATHVQALQEQGVDLQAVPADAAAAAVRQQQKLLGRERRPPNPHAMSVVMVGAECAPWSKTGEDLGMLPTYLFCILRTMLCRPGDGRPCLRCPAKCLCLRAEESSLPPAGGLGDVMQALPKALAARGHRVMVVAPRYRDYQASRCMPGCPECGVGMWAHSHLFCALILLHAV